MSASAVTGYSTTASSSTTSSTTQTAAELNSEFLTLLMAELQNQDPTNPVDDSQMIGQQAQISTLEQTENLNTNMVSLMAMESVNQAVSLVGKTVTGTVSGSSVTGTVTSVSFDSSSGSTTLNLTTSTGSSTMTLSDVTNIAS